MTSTYYSDPGLPCTIVQVIAIPEHIESLIESVYDLRPCSGS
jgi:hypothetical protein